MSKPLVIASRELKVIEKHVEELKNLQKEYPEQMNVMAGQSKDFNILIDTLQKEARCLKSNGQTPLDV